MNVLTCFIMNTLVSSFILPGGFISIKTTVLVCLYSNQMFSHVKIIQNPQDTKLCKLWSVLLFCDDFYFVAEKPLSVYFFSCSNNLIAGYRCANTGSTGTDDNLYLNKFLNSNIYIYSTNVCLSTCVFVAYAFLHHLFD